MPTLHRALVLAMVSALTACGGGSGSTGSLTPSATTSSTTPDASATLTLVFPTNVAHAAPAGTTSSAALRKPAYIDPGTFSLVINIPGGITLHDPNNPANAYFGMGTQNLSTGTSTLTVPLPSNTYNPGDISVTEYNSTTGTGTVLAGGNNTNTFTLSAGGTATPTITMVMNVAGIVLTTNPNTGTPNSGLLNQYSPMNYCGITSGTTVYAFPADASGTFVLPNQGTPPGYTGGNPANPIPGIPTVSLYSETAIGTPPTFSPSILGSNIETLVAPGGGDKITAEYQVLSPYSESTIYGWVQLGPGVC